MAGKGISKSAMWVLMGLLVIGLGGFGITNLGASIRSVGHVGTAEIDVNTYARALRNEVNALSAQRQAPVSFAQAREAGLDQRVLAQLVARAALEHEAGVLGISVSDETLRNQILDIPGFRGVDGKFDRQAYRFALQQSGLNETQFEDSIRAETSATLVQAAALAGLRPPATYTDAMIGWLGERRSLAFAVLSRGDLETGLPEPTEEDLRTYHQTHLPDFTTPEARRLTYVWITPEMLLGTVEVDEATLRAAYDERAEEYNKPERRLVVRLVFADEAAATRAMTRIAEGVRLEMLVAERGLEMADIDMGDVTATDLGPAADAVFAAQAGEVVGPVETSLGPALFRVNAVLAAQVTPFDDVRDDLRDTLALDRARRLIDQLGEAVDDLLAGGASLEEVAAETELEMGQIDWHAGSVEGIAGYPAFRRAAAEVRDTSYPAVVQLEDGGIFALRLDGVEEPRIQPLDEVREAVLAGWREEAIVAALRAQAEPLAEALRGGAGFADQGLSATEVADITRRDYRPDAPADFIDIVFGMTAGEVRLIEGAGRLFILRLDSIAPPPEDDPELARIATALGEQVTADLGQDLFQLLADDIRARAGVTLDQAALNAAHANFN